ncbi:MAG: (deoxy)nucleoside triphosphate pyrophosphohydrolase [Bacteroidota bacterium]
MPQPPAPKIFVTCALICREGRVLCTQRSSTMSLPLKWEFPGGKLEPGEAAERCVVREIAEELDLHIQVLERGPSVHKQFAPEREIELIPFVARLESGTLFLHEHAAAQWCTPDQLNQLDWAPADVSIVRWWQTNFHRF